MILPAYKKKLSVTYKNAITGDIVKTLNDSFDDAANATIVLSEKFDTGNIYNSASKIWDFVRHKINYVRDPEGYQIIQLPQALIRRGLKVNGNKNGGDCKSMALLCSGLLYNLGAKNVRLRYAGYAGSDPTHVYCVFSHNGRDILVDPVIEKFDYEKPYKFKKDYKMEVMTLSGVGETYAEQLKKIKGRLTKGTTHYNLVEKELQRQMGIQLPTESINPIEQADYIQKLQRIANWHLKNKKTGILYQLVINEINNAKNGFVTGGIAGIGKFSIKKIVKGVKKVSFAPSRNAFLGLIAINVRGLATKISQMPSDKVKNIWIKFGGDYGKLMKVVNSGKAKKPLFGGKISGIGMDPATASALAAAAPILAAFVALFSKNKSTTFNEDGMPVIDPKTGQPLMEEDTSLWDRIKSSAPDLIEKGLNAVKGIVKISQKGDVEVADDVEITDKQPSTTFGIPKNLLIFGGIGIAALLLLKKK